MINKKEIQPLLNKDKEQQPLGYTLLYMVFSFIVYLTMAFSIQYVYTDYSLLMNTGWAPLTLGQVYFSLVSFSFLRLWFLHNQTIIEYTKNELTLTENTLATFGKLLALGLCLIFYAIVKAIVF